MSTASEVPARLRSPALLRLAALAELDSAALTALYQAIDRAQRLPLRAELQEEGRAVMEPQLLLEGWAARVRTLPDGRRQVLSFILPGELVEHVSHDRPLAHTTVTAITPVVVCAAPNPVISPALRQAYAVSGALEKAYLLAQITRLGRLTALERVCDMLLELNERLELIGLARNGQFDCPLTQELLSDVLGLTPVHVNRMLQQARQQGLIEWRSRHVRILNPRALADGIGREPARVQAA